MLVAVVAAGAPAFGAAPAQEQPAPATVNSWALTPSGDDPTQPGARSNLSYTLAPGASLEDSVTLWNYSNVPLAFSLSAIDAVNGEGGDFTLVKDASESKDAGTWAKLGLDHITLPAATSVAIPLSLHVPADATPGDHTAGVIATSTTESRDAEHGQVLLERRVGTRLYVRVSGPVTPHLDVENIESAYHGSLNPLSGSLDVTYTVRNVGNVRLGARQTVEVNDLFGSVASEKPKAIAELLPGNTAKVTVHFDDVPATFRLSTDVSIQPFTPTASDVAAPEKITRSASVWAVPWALLLLVAALALAAWGWARWRRRSQSAAPTGPQRQMPPAAASGGR